jgi:uncharacterized metal-binding protein
MNEENENSPPSCATCGLETFKRICFNEKGTASKGCPTLSKKTATNDALKVYEDSEICEFARQASIQEGECYANRIENPFVLEPTKTRIVEICEFARKMGYKRLGLAFCVGLAKEAGIVADILKLNGFEVVSVMCKVGRVLKDKIGIKDEEKIMPGIDEAMCNPVLQAKVLNDEKTEFNILLGLCVGHDSLFFKHADAYTTVLAVKDRVTGHNPLAAIYLSHSYYMKIMK